MSRYTASHWNGFLDASLFLLLESFVPVFTGKPALGPVNSKLVRECKGRFFYVPAVIIDFIGDHPWLESPGTVVLRFLNSVANCEFLELTEFSQRGARESLRLLMEAELSACATRIEDEDFFRAVFQQPNRIIGSAMDDAKKIGKLREFNSALNCVEKLIVKFPESRHRILQCCLSLSELSSDLVVGASVLFELHEAIPNVENLKKRDLFALVNSRLSDDFILESCASKRLIGYFFDS